MIFLKPNISKGLGLEGSSFLSFFARFFGLDFICGLFRFFCTGFGFRSTTGFNAEDSKTTATSVASEIADLIGGGPLYSFLFFKVYLGVLKKGGGSGYPQALLEGLTSEARY